MDSDKDEVAPLRSATPLMTLISGADGGADNRFPAPWAL
jgi:hypothetical protein